MHLLTGLLESLANNRRRPVPQKFFELGNVVQFDPNSTNDAHTSEERRLAFAVIGPEAGYAEARSFLDSVIGEWGFTATYEPGDFPAFIEGRNAKVTLSNGFNAIIGEVHPEVLNNFNLSYPVAMGELTLARVI